jgi:betaine-aldehyde dehydrogenase
MNDLASSPRFVAEDPMDLIRALDRTILINGTRRAVAKGLDVVMPATGATLGQAAGCAGPETAEAVAAARAAFEGWKAIPARARGKAIADAGRALSAQAEAIAQVLACETGKAIRTECRGELAVAADLLEFYGGLGSELKGESIPYDPRMLTVTTREPIGVVGAIVPWNVPLVLMMLKIGPALVAGNTVVVKASEEAPFATLLAAEIVAAHLPPGVLNVICGTGMECGAALTAHPDVAKITFTGSEAAGEQVYMAGAKRIVPVSLELGGKSAMIVCDDADIDRAVAGAISGMRFTRQGQSCTAASRIYVHDSLYEVFVDRLKVDLDRMVIGDPLDEATDIGTVISARQAAIIRRYVSLAEDTPGAEVVRCGQLPCNETLSSELFLQPTLLLNLPEDHPCIREEIFGPVTAILRWSDYNDVIRRANDSTYGLAATVWTGSMKTALDATARLEAGYVQVNQNLTIQPNLSYGGFGRSGLGKEASLEAMLEHFTRKKTVVLNFD